MLIETKRRSWNERGCAGLNWRGVPADSSLSSVARVRRPLGFDSSDTNFYRYVHNDPTGYTDPSGLVVYPGLTNTVEHQDDVVKDVKSKDGKIAGKLIVSKNATFFARDDKKEVIHQHGDKDGMFIAFRGDKCENVEWIQFGKFIITMYYNIKGKLETDQYALPQAKLQTKSGEIVGVTTAADKPVYFLDVNLKEKLKTPYYREGFLGDIASGESYIFDRPSPHEPVEGYKKFFEMKDNRIPELAGLKLTIQFDTYAVNKDDGKPFARVSWESYSGYIVAGQEKLVVGVGTLDLKDHINISYVSDDLGKNLAGQTELLNSRFKDKKFIVTD